MNPDLLEQLRGLLGPSRTASTPLPPVMVTAPARQPTMGPRSGTEIPSVAEPRVSAGRLATELGVGMTPIGASPDVAAMIRDAAEGNYGGAALNATFAAMGMVPFGGALSRGARGLSRRVFGTHEFIPGKGAGHLSGLLTATPVEREAYSRAVDWRDPEGRDILYRAAGLSPDATRQATGLYRTASGIETNPLSVARAQAPATEAGRSALNTVEGVRALLNAQNAGAYHSVTASPTGTGIRLPMVGPADPDLLTRLDDVAQNWRGGAVDTGRGVTILGPTWGDAYPVDAMFSDLRQSLSSVPLTGRPYVADTQPQGYFSLFEDAPPGGGQATRTALQDADLQTLMALGQDPEVLSRISDFRRADLGAQAQYGPTNPAIERFRREAARPGGLASMYNMVRNAPNDPLLSQLPALALLTGGGAMAMNAEDGEGMVPGATLAAAGLLTGRPRRSFEAWHGSPVRGITRFDPDMSSPGVIAGKGTYVAGDDVFGAGRRQATGYIGGPQSYMSAGGRPAPIGNPMVHDIMESLGYSRPAALQATSAYSRVSANTPLPSGKVFSDDQWQAYTENLRDAWLDELSRRAERGTMPETLAAQQAAQAVARGDIAANRGALYRLNIDADPERMLNRDAAIDEQPEYVSQVVRDIQQQLGYAPRMNTAQGFFNVLQNETDPDEAVRLLLERGIQGIRADAGDYPVSRAALEAGNASPQMRRSQMAPSTQYTIFDPERIRILDMLAPALAAGGLGAYVANQPAVPDA